MWFSLALCGSTELEQEGVDMSEEELLQMRAVEEREADAEFFGLGLNPSRNMVMRSPHFSPLANLEHTKHWSDLEKDRRAKMAKVHLPLSFCTILHCVS